jgi:hypothetical protein
LFNNIETLLGFKHTIKRSSNPQESYPSCPMEMVSNRAAPSTSYVLHIS